MQSDDLVVEFCQRHANAPLSQSPEWDAIRADSVGGSDVACLLGLNPFKKRAQFIADKCGFGQPFTGNDATRWGIIMEVATSEFTRLALKMDGPIFALGSLPTSIVGQRYTPDGIGTVYLRNACNEIKKFIVVFEFKSPFKSLPDGKIPKHYAPQLQTGLLAVNIAHVGVFTNCMFRKCAMFDLNFTSTYNTTYHAGDLRKPTRFTKAYAVHMVYFTVTPEEMQLFKSGYYHNEQDDDIIYGQLTDVNEASPRVTERIMQLAAAGRLQTCHMKPCLNHTMINQIELIQTHCLQHVQQDPEELKKEFDKVSRDNMIAFMPCKLMKADILILERNKGWTNILTPVVADTLQCIREIKASPDPYYEYCSRFKTPVDESVYNNILNIPVEIAEV
jgi:hypothetical protein